MSCTAHVFAPMSTMQCAWHRLRLAVAFVVLLIFSFIPAVRCLLQQWLFMSRFCQRGNRDPSIDLFFDPNDWIDKRSEEHTSELQSHSDLVCRLLLEKKK